MSAASNPNAEPEHIAISKSKGIEIDWIDGAHSSLGLELLRRECPCATCTGAHGTTPQKWQPDTNPLKMFQAKLKMESVEAVGNYAIRIYWNDGHNAGIYSYNHLRSLPSGTAAAVE
ncbi:MAG: gamma-butyrobetaine hydroxylase-like domain-containing protein [Bryobacteraceae bacterium]